MPFLKSRILEYGTSIFQKHGIVPAGYILYGLSILSFIFRLKKHAVALLLRSNRFSHSPAPLKTLSRLLSKNPQVLNSVTSEVTSADDVSRRAIVLSLPYNDGGRLVKGVMLLKFSHTFSYFLQQPLWSKLDSLFAFVLEPSWSGYADPDILEIIRRSEHCVVQTAELGDRAVVNSLFPETPCIDIGSGNWVDHSRFAPSKGDRVRDIDVIYVANAQPFKRVFAAIDIFVTVTHQKPDLSAVIVCASGGGEVDDFRRYVRLRGVAQNVEIIRGMKQHDLVSYLKRSKVSILLSLKEGSSRILFESMFVDVPVMCLAENYGVNKGYINNATGLVVHEIQFAEVLLRMISDFRDYEPRAWAVANISASCSRDTVANAIRMKYGASVNSRIVTKINCPEVQYKELGLDCREVTRNLLSWTHNGTTPDIIERMRSVYAGYFERLSCDHSGEIAAEFTESELPHNSQ